MKVSVLPRGVPVIVMMTEPRVAVEDAVKVNVDEHVGLQAAMAVAVTPAGRADRLKLTGVVVPETKVAVTVTRPLVVPLVTVTGSGDTRRL